MPETTPDTNYAALPPVRGLILGHNRRGDAADPTALRQWLRLNVERFKTQKVDCWEPEGNPARMLSLLEEAAHLGTRLSLYTDLSTPAEILPVLAEAGLLDVHLRADSADFEEVHAWADACAGHGLPLRLSVHAGLLQPMPTAPVFAAIGRAAVVTVYLDEWLVAGNHRACPRPCLEHARALAEALQHAGPEVHLADIPFCQAPPPLWPYVSNGPQRLAHHQHCHPDAEAFAREMAGLSPGRMQQAIEIELGHGASFHNPIDRAVLPWILEKPRGLFWIWFFHKLTRRMLPRKAKPRPLPEDTTYLEHKLAELRAKQARDLGPQCARCRLHPICDHHTETFKRTFPGIPVAAIPGDPCVDPLAFRDPQRDYFDAIDSARRQLPERHQALAQRALETITSQSPSREIPAESYALEDHATDRMPASVRWFSFSTAELQSTVLAHLSPPFTLAVTFGGGMADRIGFSFGRHARVLCPMTAYNHKLALHVDAAGYYVLLRDGVPVAPCGVSTMDTVPERLGTIVEPRLAAVNIDGQLVTQTVLLWAGSAAKTANSPPVHSVVMVCTRFARRLQAALRTLARQEPLEAGALEVIVGYVPGMDATDDVLDAMEACYPHLGFRRVPFAPDRFRAKGFMINECVALASGAWVTLLDADILLPVDYFSRLDALPREVRYAAPDGRYMLDARTTAAILLGDIAPWKDYTGLQEGAPEYRHRESEGLPPGFCQSFRREVFDEIRYAELDHFEGSDWLFSKSMVDRFGPETRLVGVRVLHLDHGGSQWYGTGKQR